MQSLSILDFQGKSQHPYNFLVFLKFKVILENLSGMKFGDYLFQSPAWNGIIATTRLAIILPREQRMLQASVILY